MADIVESNIEWNHGPAWSAKLEIGDRDIDHQHKRIFKFLNTLIESCKINDTKFAIEETLIYLVDYLLYHLAEEERTTRRYKYPKYVEHKQMHDNFTVTVRDLTNEYEKNGDSETLFSAVNNRIVKWLIQHIQREDLKIAQYIKRR